MTRTFAHVALTAIVFIACSVSAKAFRHPGDTLPPRLVTDLQGGCEVQCEEPSGALFCNGQYVSASDVDACITYLQENFDASVDVSARGEVTCDLSGCTGTGDAAIGWCSVSNAGAVAGGTGGLAAAALALGTALARRRRPSKK